MALNLFNDDWPFGASSRGYGAVCPFTTTPMSLSFNVPRYLRDTSAGLSRYLADEFRQMQVLFRIHISYDF